MIGIAGIVSLASGLLSGAVPKVLDMIEKKQDFSHQVEMLELQNQLKITLMERQSEKDMDATQAKLLVEEMHGIREQMVAIQQPRFQQVGVPWIDKFNAVIRPVTTATFLVLFVVGLLSYWFGIGAVNAEFGAHLGALFTMTVEGIIGFFFGYRSAIKPPAWLSGSAV